MSDKQDVAATAPDEPTIKLTLPIEGEMPEYIEINGVDYGRLADEVDQVVNYIRGYQQIAQRTGLSLRQAVWLRHFTVNADQPILPD